MMNNYYEMQKIGKLKSIQYEDKAARERQARQALAGQPDIASQILVKAAQILIAAGESLKALIGNESTLNA